MIILGSALLGTSFFSPPPDNAIVVDGRVVWRFDDVVSGGSYDFHINPSECTLPEFQRNVTSQPTAAGGQVIYSGRNIAPTMTFSGTILHEEQYNNFQLWVRTKRQIRITDDLGGRYWVYMLSFQPTRQRNTPYPWRMDYSATALILDWSAT